MCGIGGILAWDERFRVTREMMGKISRAIAHRGPDDEGIYWKDEKVQVGLVFRRLAILDPDPRANQPFVDDRGRALVFNGEIYNFREIRAEIEKAGADYRWRTSGDTEVLLAAYATWGRECLAKLNGMFAFAVWTPAGVDGKARGELFLARDRMGQKPLYIAHQPNGAIAFASELPALRMIDWVSGEIDPQGLTDYLMWGYVPRSDATIYKAIGKLPPSSWMSIEPGGKVETGKYFEANRPAVNGGAKSAEKIVSRTRHLLMQSVRRQLVSDVPLGCFLSGGIDSSIIAAAMRAAVGEGQRVLTFSIGFDDRRYDETKFAAAVAKHLGTEHRQFVVRPNAADDLPRLAAVFGEPFGDSSALPTHYLSRETRKFVKVALSGDGGDEMFGGYDRYRAMALGQKVGALPKGILQLAGAGKKLPGSHPKSPVTKLKRFLATVDLPAGQRYASYLQIFDQKAIGQLLNDDLAAHVSVNESQTVVAERFEQLAQKFELATAAMALDREIYLPEDLLTKVDRCSMLHALEVRSPFLDHELVHFAASLPSVFLQRKRLLKEAFAGDLPAFVFRRKKMGFAVPIGRWFRGSLRSMLHDELLAGDSFASSHFKKNEVEGLISAHQRGRDQSQKLYALLMLELWWKSAHP
jgi:asparagine synthase (glutamine-hydrolysing)